MRLDYASMNTLKFHCLHNERIAWCETEENHESWATVYTNTLNLKTTGNKTDQIHELRLFEPCLRFIRSVVDDRNEQEQ